MERFRLIADPYDSAHQLDFGSRGDRESLYAFLGRLRLDAILYEKVVVNDAAIFDGAFFLNAAQFRLLAELPWNRIEVAMRAPNLKDCMLRAFRSPDSKTLTPVYHSSIKKDCDATALSFDLGNTDANTVDSLESYISTLQALGVPSKTAEGQLSLWEELDAFLRLNKTHTSLWSRPFEFEHQLERTKGYAESVLETDPGRDTFARVWETRALRSVAYAHLARSMVGADIEVAKDVETIRTWYNFAYKNAQAVQANCDSVEIRVSEKCRPYMETELPLARRLNDLVAEDKFGIPEGFLYSLGKIPRKSFDLLTSGVISTGVAEWRQKRMKGDPDARSSLKRSMESLITVVQNEIPFFTVESAEIADSASNVLGVGAGMVAFEKLRSSAAELITRRFFSLGATALAAASFGFAVDKGTKSLLEPTNTQSLVAESIVRMEDFRQQRSQDSSSK